MKSKAAVLFSKKKVKVIDVIIPPPEKYQVLVKNIFSSICHTQLGEYLMKRGRKKLLIVYIKISKVLLKKMR